MNKCEHVGGRLQVNKFEQNLLHGVPYGQKDMTENITFPQTTYAGDNLVCVHWWR